MEEQLQSRDAILDELKHHLTHAQDKMKALTDDKHRDVQFQVGDMVYLKLRPFRQKTLAVRWNEKLAHFYGPYEVLVRVGAVARSYAFLSRPQSIQCFMCHNYTMLLVLPNHLINSLLSWMMSKEWWLSQLKCWVFRPSLSQPPRTNEA